MAGSRAPLLRAPERAGAAVVQAHGLLLTNHHVARGQLQKNSTAEHDFVKNGFYAATPAEEMKSPDLEVNVLRSMENVTQTVQAALKGAMTPAEEFTRRKAAIARIERESLEKTGLRSDVVTLYQGGEYWLYRYRKYTDVRLVFAPEDQAAFFGGDPDNFTYPRYDLDMALFRVYENGKPIDTKDYLKWNPAGATDGELVFVPGHPGSTQRQDTVAQLEFERDFYEPIALKLLKNRVAVLEQYSAQGTEQARQAASLIFGLQNSVKAYEGRYKGLLDKTVMDTKRNDEQDFKAKVMANPAWRQAYGGAWDAISEATRKNVSRAKQQLYRGTDLERQNYRGMDSQLATTAATIVAYVAEVQKPDGERLQGFHEAQLESLRHRLFSPAPTYPGLEIARMTGALEADLTGLGAEDPFVRIVLDGRSPREAATALVNGTKLADPAFRKQLVEGGVAAVSASTDPMIAICRKLDPLRRESIKWQEDNVKSVDQAAGEKLGKARFAVYGKSAYPDATFTLRLSYGQVKGYPMNGTEAPYKTTFYGLFDRATSFDFEGPFYLPSRYKENRTNLDLATPLDFVTTNDIIGGNSGSPVINRNADIVGLIFDGNIESLVGDFVYEGATNRAVAVHTAGMTEALRKLYGADRLVREMLGE